jgi:glycosyltransferase involved in cell wall biosynthesis
MSASNPSTAILVTTYPGQRPLHETAKLAAAGGVPRNSAAELAHVLDADIIDNSNSATGSARVYRILTRLAGLPAALSAEVLLRGRSYRTVIAWADRLGLPLALVNKLIRRRQTLFMISVDLSHPKKAFFLRRLHVDRQMRAIICSSSVQIELVSEELGVPREKLHLIQPGVDTRFWQPGDRPGERRFCSVGSEARDWATFVAAVADVDAEVEVALGSIVLANPTGSEHPDNVQEAPESGTGVRLDPLELMKGTAGHKAYQRWLDQRRGAVPDRIRWYMQLKSPQLRNLYARSCFVVIPLHNVEFDAGYTTILEAMAMGKAVIVTRTRGQVDLVTEGEQGLYVDPANPAALRAAINRLLDSPEDAQRMGLAGRRLVEERYTLDGYIQQLADLVRQG